MDNLPAWLGLIRDFLAVGALAIGLWISIRSATLRPKDPRRENLKIDLENLQLARTLELHTDQLDEHVRGELHSLYDDLPRQMRNWRFKVWPLGVCTLVLGYMMIEELKAREFLEAGIFAIAVIPLSVGWWNLMWAQPAQYGH